MKMIAAVGKDLGIGFRGRLPWTSMAEDMHIFRELTTGHTVVMGRRTWDSIKRPLPYRGNIVLSETMEQHFGEQYPLIAKSVEEAVRIASVLKDKRPDTILWVIGGASLYSAFADLADELRLTWIDGVYQADTFFPKDVLDKFNKVDELWTFDWGRMERRTKVEIPWKGEQDDEYGPDCV